MKLSWLNWIFLISITLLISLTWHEKLHLNKFYPYQRSLKLQYLEEKEENLSKKDSKAFQVWKSILTGNTKKIDKTIKDQYSRLALSHVFTPSGFHLTAVMSPFIKIFSKKIFKLIFIILICILAFNLNGLLALKRMSLIKLFQFYLSNKIGFLSAITLDLIFGTFKNSPLSFTYSFLFLGIIYSDLTGIRIIFLFFFAQMLIAFFQSSTISLLLIVWSPILNLFFGLLLPIIFLLSFPMFDWQLKSGIFLIEKFNMIVELADKTLTYLPILEMSLFTLIIFLFFIKRKSKLLIFLLLINSNGVNKSTTNKMKRSKYELSHLDKFYCSRALTTGIWQISCSPYKRRSTSNKKIN